MFECLKEKCKANFVYKKQLEALTGGILSNRSLEAEVYKNDPLKPITHKIGNKIIYNLNDLILWMNSRFSEYPKA